MSSMRPGVYPRTLFIGKFRKPTQTPPRSPETPGNIYYAIALTTLTADTGILNFFPRDSGGTNLGQAEVLEPGDGIICRGEDGNPSGGGEGGIVLMIHYQAGNDRPRD